MTHDYQNPATQAERRKEVERDSYFRRAQGDAETELGGRYKKPVTVIGAGVPEYPRLPANSPWATPDPTGPEPPLGYEIDALPEPELGGAPASPCAETATLNDPIPRTDPRNRYPFRS